MGVDYSAISGIGVKVFDIKDGDEDTDLYDKLEELDYKDLYSYAVGGNEYAGEKNFYILIEDPFKDGYNIISKVGDFMKWLYDNKIIFTGTVDVISDLNIY